MGDGAAPEATGHGTVPATPATSFDAIVVVSFGGPEGMDDVRPFLENVTRGRNVPPARLDEVAHHYAQFGGVSPLNAQNRALSVALRDALDAHGIDLPISLGNRNWHPLLPDTLREMADAGVGRALAFFTSAFSSYSGCRQYREDVWRARLEVGAGAPELVQTRMFHDHPGFIGAMADRVRSALVEVPPERVAAARVLFSAHSIPLTMARHCRYEAQLAAAAELIAERVGAPAHEVVYQSRSGPPHVPWLEPDVCERLRALANDGVTDVVVAPLGFLSDHIEVLYDLDDEARGVADEVGIRLVRAGTVGTHPLFVACVRDLIKERLTVGAPRAALGPDGPSPDACAPDCCLPGTGQPSPWEDAPAQSV